MLQPPIRIFRADLYRSLLKNSISPGPRRKYTTQMAAKIATAPSARWTSSRNLSSTKYKVTTRVIITTAPAKIIVVGTSPLLWFASAVFQVFLPSRSCKARLTVRQPHLPSLPVFRKQKQSRQVGLIPYPLRSFQ